MPEEHSEVTVEKEDALILSVDDHEENNMFIRMMLEDAGFKVETTTDSMNAFNLAVDLLPDVIILDIQMQKTGFEVCKELKEDERTSSIPVIFVSAIHTSAGMIAEGLQLGSNDFIRKPFNPVELVARINVAIRIRNAEAKIRELLAIDPLSGLYNRRMMYEMFMREIERSRRYEDPFAVLLFDIDHFKTVNDTYGHLAGDDAINHVSEVVTGSFRKTDLCCRYGGDEFCVLLPRTTQEHALELAERLRHNIEELPISHNEEEFSITISVGVSTREDIEMGLNADTLIKEADLALFEGKKLGRNRVNLFKPDYDYSKE